MCLLCTQRGFTNTEEMFHLLQYLVFLWAQQVIPRSASSELLWGGG